MTKNERIIQLEKELENTCELVRQVFEKKLSALESLCNNNEDFDVLTQHYLTLKKIYNVNADILTEEQISRFEKLAYDFQSVCFNNGN